MLETLTHPASLVALLVAAYLACVCFVHFRGKVRLRFERQLTEHSGLFSPLNSLLYLFSAVPKDPFLQASRFPQLAKLRENWTKIRDEAIAVYSEGRIDYNADQQDLAFVSFKKLGWKRFHMKWYGDFLPSALSSCPRTVELLRSIPDVNAAAFTLLPPGAKLGRHRDPFASSLRYHLGLLCPRAPGCRIWVDGEEHTWRDGEDVVFDETYIHWAKNETDEPRLILFVDFTRPLHTPVARALNNLLIRYGYGITASHNDKHEKRGLLNHVTPVFFHLKAFFRGLKARMDRRVYYACKYALLAGAGWLVVRAIL